MAITDHDSLSKDFAEGRARSALQSRASVSQGARADLPMFLRYVILETIFDPQIIDQVKLDYWEHELGVSNITHATVAPANSIIARRVQSNNSSAEQAMVFYPFFPPNLGLPAQPGEHVWCMFEDPTGTKNDLGYWFCRIVTANHAEDINHTHPHRAHDSSFVAGTRDSFEGTDVPFYEFRNGVVGEIDGERYTMPETATAPGGDDAYKRLMKETDAGRLMHYESVPRYRKRPGEQVLQGSNNTLIVMGRDRSGPVATYVIDDEKGSVPRVPIDDVNVDGAGLIDLVAGRGQTPSTGGESVENDLQARELGKGKKQQSPNEGDVDYKNDRSRVLISQKTPVDLNFEVQRFIADLGITEISRDGDGAVVIKSDRIRFIARSDVAIVVKGFTRNSDGNMVDDDNVDNHCAIALKSNGEIVLKPSLNSTLKLGGDDADKAILCTDLPASVASGIVSGPPIASTMGGMIGGSIGDKGALAAGQGRYASKILVK